MSDPQLRIHPNLLQHYVLDVHPESIGRVREALLDRPHKDDTPIDVDDWNLYCWLNRPAIWAMRGVRNTSGLDTFLITTEGLNGVTDVAEWMVPVFGGEDGEGPALASSWSEFALDSGSKEILFATFLWLDWQALETAEAWAGNPIPMRSTLIAAIRRAFARGLVRVGTEFSRPPAAMLAGCMGDADLILYGRVRSTRDLDLCLYLMTQMGCDTLAEELFGADSALEPVFWPVVRGSRTELAVPLSWYEELLRSVRPGSEEVPAQPDAISGGPLAIEVSLHRSHGTITSLQDKLKQVIGPEWHDHAVFGQDDFIIRPAPRTPGLRARDDAEFQDQATTVSFTQMLSLLARLDHARIGAPGFPRRGSLRLGFMDPIGRSGHLSRQILFGNAIGSASDSPRPQHRGDDPLNWVSPLRRMIMGLRGCGWREDLRILERVAERCVTLRKSDGLPPHTRHMLASALRRFGATCQRIHQCEEELAHHPAVDGESAITRIRDALALEIQFLRDELHQSGNRLDRVLSHHSRGTVGLLLHPECQARGATHFASDTGLSSGLAVLLRSPVLRLIRTLASAPTSPVTDEWRSSLIRDLHLLAQPIIYASHEPGFHIFPGLILLHVPTWALWQPSSCTHLLHELGHSFSVVGSLEYLARKLMWRLSSAVPCACTAFELEIARLGWTNPGPNSSPRRNAPPINELGPRFLRHDAASNATRLPPGDPRQLHLLEEIAADAVERLFCYPPGLEGAKAHLENTLTTITPSCARLPVHVNVTRLHRLFAGQLAVHLARTTRDHRWRPLAEHQTTLWQLSHDYVQPFCQMVKQWVGDFLRRFECQSLSPTIRSTLEELPRRLESDEAAWREFKFLGYLTCIVLCIRPIENTRFQSLYKSTHVWGNLLEVATMGPDEERNLADLASILALGRVPPAPAPFPERLVAALAHPPGQPHLPRIGPHARLALCTYLSSQFWAPSDQPSEYQTFLSEST